MDIEIFKQKLLDKIYSNLNKLQSEDKSWTVKGFVDIFKNIYTISVDTKVISKILELMLFPIISEFAKENNLKIDLAEYQNHYPDITFIDGNQKIALDIKSTYRISEETVNGFTLGSFTGFSETENQIKISPIHIMIILFI